MPNPLHFSPIHSTNHYNPLHSFSSKFVLFQTLQTLNLSPAHTVWLFTPLFLLLAYCPLLSCKYYILAHRVHFFPPHTAPCHTLYTPLLHILLHVKTSALLSCTNWLLSYPPHSFARYTLLLHTFPLLPQSLFLYKLYLLSYPLLSSSIHAVGCPTRPAILSCVCMPLSNQTVYSIYRKGMWMYNTGSMCRRIM